jgi:hypothetical protein
MGPLVLHMFEVDRSGVYQSSDDWVPIYAVASRTRSGARLACTNKLVGSYSILIISAHWHDRRAEYKTEATSICYLDLSRCNNDVLISTSRGWKQCLEMTLPIVSSVWAIGISRRINTVPYDVSRFIAK